MNAEECDTKNHRKNRCEWINRKNREKGKRPDLSAAKRKKEAQFTFWSHRISTRAPAVRERIFQKAGLKHRNGKEKAWSELLEHEQVELKVASREEKFRVEQWLVRSWFFSAVRKQINRESSTEYTRKIIKVLITQWNAIATMTVSKHMLRSVHSPDSSQIDLSRKSHFHWLGSERENV